MSATCSSPRPRRSASALGLRQRVEAIASRERDTDARLSARETAVAEREETLADREKRVGAQAERVDRERTGHGRASQEAFALMSELERREQEVARREAELRGRQTLREAEAPKLQARDQLLARGEAHLASLREQLDRRGEQAVQTAHEQSEREAASRGSEREVRVQEARLGADLELREEKLDQLAEELAERERRLADRERGLCRLCRRAPANRRLRCLRPANA